MTAIHPIADGRWTVLGGFGEIDGVELPWSVARIGKDGALNRSYVLPKVLNDPSGDIIQGALGGLRDGSVLMQATRFDDNSGYDLLSISKLLPDASVDGGFRSDPAELSINSWSASMVSLPDGGALIQGREVDQSRATETGWDRLIRINADGSVDESFGQIRFSAVRSGGWKLAPTFKFKLDQVSQGGHIVLPVSGLPAEYRHESQLVLLRTSNAPRTTISFETTTIAVSESQTTNAVRVLRFGDTSREESVSVTADNLSARIGVDYLFSVPAARVIFRPLETEALIPISLMDNAIVDTERSLRLSLSGSAEGTEIERSSATVLIKDDDRAGSIDASFQFNPQAILNWGPPSVELISLLPDGRLQTQGSFPFEERWDCTSFAQILPNGRLDPTSDRIACPPWVIAWLSGGRSLINRDYRLMRLLPDGQIDNSFSRTMSAEGIEVAAEQQDGSLIVGGGFTSLGGSGISKVGRLKSDGSIDPTFLPRLSGNDLSANRFEEGNVSSIAVQPDGKILISGYPRVAGRDERVILARLEPNGALDSTFRKWVINPTSLFSNVGRLVYRSDGHVFLVGQLVNPTTFSSQALLELGSDGQIIRTLDWGAGPEVRQFGRIEVGWIRDMIMLPDGDLLLGGYFTHFDGIRASGIVKLNLNPPDAPRIATANLENGALRLIAHVVANAKYTLEISEDLRTWTKAAELIAINDQIEFSDLVASAGGAKRFYRFARR